MSAASRSDLWAPLPAMSVSDTPGVVPIEERLLPTFDARGLNEVGGSDGDGLEPPYAATISEIRGAIPTEERLVPTLDARGLCEAGANGDRLAPP